MTKTLIEKYNIKDSVELVLEKDCIIIKPTPIPRKGWDESFKLMNASGDDNLLINDVLEDENFEEWT